ncbi:hypothetical protein AAU57_05580 [Nonlabens sp. YIK11]|uniref:hypothetical protein n=1 Tax=Nonlabens sp. YIK11 TaxID=1453349 RepID=UPI0006DBE290|nr:hypothetical protein [Nonlabens sp. YIK11]KQC32841.1 hypothetical protein AAU57_05580 [Nonlabens sp. YIK11]
MKRIIYLLALIVLLTSCHSYGDRVATGGVEVYYNDPEIKEQATQFSMLMDSLEYGQDGMVSFQLVKDSIINVNMVTQDQYHTDESMDYALNEISLLLSHDIFKGERVQLHVSDNTFNRVRSLEVYGNE